MTKPKTPSKNLKHPTGVKKNEIKLNVTENSLEVSAQHKEESKEKKKNYTKRTKFHSIVHFICQTK